MPRQKRHTHSEWGEGVGDSLAPAGRVSASSALCSGVLVGGGEGVTRSYLVDLNHHQLKLKKNIA